MGHKVEEYSEQCLGGGVCSSKVKVQEVKDEWGLWKGHQGEATMLFPAGAVAHKNGT